MKDCNCKNGPSMNEMLEGENENKVKLKLGSNILKYSLKTLGFLLFLILLPIINLIIIWFAFNLFVLNKNVDIKQMLMFIGNGFRKTEIEETLTDDELDMLTEDDVYMVGVEDITNKITSK
jgi:hypothetical protein